MGMDLFAKQVIQRPRLALLVAAIFVLGSLSVLPKLEFEQDTLYLFRTAQTADTETFADENTVVVLVGAPDCLQPVIVDALREFVREISSLDHVQRVLSIQDARRPERIGKLFLRLFPKDYDQEDLPKIRERVAEHPLLHDHLISADHTWTRIIIQVDPAIKSESLHSVVSKIKSTANRSFASTDATTYVTGLPAVQLEIKQSLIRDQRLFISGGILAGFILSFLIFRSWRSVLIVMAGPVIGAVCTFGFMAIWGEAINPLNVVVIPMALTIALTDAVHLQLQIQRLRETGSDCKDAVHQAMVEVGPACILTSLTTMIGFGSLATAQLLTIQRFGIICGISVALSLMAVLIAVPALAVLLMGTQSAPIPRRSDKRIDSAFHRIGHFSITYRRTITVVSLLAMALMLWEASSLKPRISMAEGLPLASDAQRAVAIADGKFGGTLPLTLTVSWSPKVRPPGTQILAATQSAVELVEGESLFAPPLSYLDLLRSLPGQRSSELTYVPEDLLNQFIDGSLGRSYVTTWVPDAGSDQLSPRLTAFNQRLGDLEKAHTGFRFSYNRRDFEPIHLGGTLIGDLALSLLTAAILCTLTIAIGFRSWRLGLIALLPNCLPLVATACLMALLGIALQLTSVTVFAIALGVAVDDTIHVLRRYSLSRRNDQESRVVDALVHVGRPICLTTSILVVGLSVVLLSQIPAMHQFGMLFILSLGWALIGDLLLLPALLRIWAVNEK